MPAAAADLLERGRSAFAAGRARDAVRLLRRGLAAGAGPELHARLLISLALAEFELRGQPAAHALLSEAAGLIDEHDLRGARAALHNQRGLIALRQGDLAGASHEFDAGVAAAGAAGVDDRCRIWTNRAVVRMDRGDLRGARHDLTRCITAARTAGLPRHETMATHDLGYLEYLVGDLPLALRLMADARRIDPSVSPGVSLLGEAYVLVEAGLLARAEATLAEACGILAAQRLTVDLAEALLERARCALALGDAAAAQRYAAGARDRYRRRGHEAGRRAAELVAVQARLASGSVRARTAELLAARAAALRDGFAADGLRLPARRSAVLAGEALLAAGRPAGARAALATAGPLRRADPITGRLASHDVQARLDVAAGRPGAARRRIARAQDELAAYQASFGSLDLRTAAAVHGRRLAALDLELAFEDGRPAAIFEAAERFRAVSHRAPPVRPPADPEAAGLLSELRQTLEALRLAATAAESEPLLRRRRELEARIVARDWQARGGGAPVRAAASLDAVGSAVGDGRTLVSFVQAGSRLWAVVVGTAVVACDLGPLAPVLETVRRVRADLDIVAAPRLPGPIRDVVRASLTRGLALLAASLVTPLALPPGVPLVIVSTGLLGQVPWASLPPLAGTPVVVAPSATAWLAASSASELSAPAPGGTRRSADNAAGTSAVAALAGPGLARAADEARAAGRAWGSPVRAEAGTRAQLADALRTARVVHVAAHGVHEPQSPLFSSVRMSDGPLFAHELDAAAGLAEHVVLSACEVGLATVRPGDEALGLAAVLLQLGARCVVAGVARVSDEQAAAVMAGYHARLATGSDAAGALAASLADTADDGVVAPFVAFGASWAA